MPVRIIVTGLFIFVCVVFVVYYFFMHSENIVNYPPKSGPIVAFGDSLVVGVGSPETEGFIAPLADLVGEPIQNRGVRGDTTADGLARIETVLELKPRIVLLLLGGNDYLRKVPKAETSENLRTLIKTLQAEGILVVLLGVRGGVLTDGYETMYEEMAQTTGSVYVENVLDGIFGNASLMSDSIHPNREGYARIAKKVYVELEPVLR
jgi:acyl-CoA thioesterase-1